MIFFHRVYPMFFIGFLSMLSCSNGKELIPIPNNRVMTVEEFKQSIDSNEFLKTEHLTTSDKPLDEHEIELIELARKYQNLDFGGKVEQGREINKFTGNTLLVGGGKTAGLCGENDGKTILIDYRAEEAETKELIENLRSGRWTHDPYTGKDFKTTAEKEFYIKELEEKTSLYKEAFREKNNDILNRYYILNIEDKIFPDMLGSITSESDMSKIPDNKFMHIEFENVPCDVFLNPRLYTILERITKPQGTITFSISHACRRLIVPVIQSTKFGDQFMQLLKKEIYDKFDEMDSTYGSCNITVTNL